MKPDELRNLEDEKLRAQIDEYHEELFNLRFQQKMGKLTATGRPRIVKREIRHWAGPRIVTRPDRYWCSRA